MEIGKALTKTLFKAHKHGSIDKNNNKPNTSIEGQLNK